MQAGAEEANKFKESAVDLAGQIVDAGGRIEDVDLGGIISAWGRQTVEDNWITPWTNEASTKFQETAKDARAAGVDINDAVKGSAGSAADSQKLLDATGQAWQDLSAKIEEGTTYGQAGEEQLDASAQAAKTQRDALSDLRGQAETNIKTTGDAIEIAKIETGVTEDGTAATEAATKALEAKAQAMADAAGNAMDAVTAEIDYNDNMAQGAKDIAANGKGLDLHTAVGKANAQTLVDMAKSANDLRDAQVNAGTSTADITAKQVQARDAFINAAVAAGKGKVEAGKLADQYGLVPGNVDTYVKAHDVQKTKDEIKGVAAPVSVPVTPYIPAGAKWSFAQELANATAPVVQSVSLRILKNNGMALP
jgi:hypothetical protein